MSKNLVPVSEMDYLEEDDPIRGQQFVCLSFLSPEEIIENKNVFFFNKFISNFKNEVSELFTNLKNKYKDEEDIIQTIIDKYRFLFNDKWIHEEYNYFVKENEEKINKEFSETVDFQTSVRGIKIRGSYETMREAQIRSEVLKRKDKKHNIFIASVGCWCPWDPNPDNIDDQHYSEDRLNTLMKKYKENQAAKDELFENRKQQMIDNQQKKNNQLKLLNKNVENVENDKNDENDKNVENDKNDENDENVENDENDENDKNVENEIISSSGLNNNEAVEENYNETQNEEETQKVFEDQDPWMKKQNEN
jgi:hypothetical protein